MNELDEHFYSLVRSCFKVGDKNWKLWVLGWLRCALPVCVCLERREGREAPFPISFNLFFEKKEEEEKLSNKLGQQEKATKAKKEERRTLGRKFKEEWMKMVKKLSNGTNLYRFKYGFVSVTV